VNCRRGAEAQAQAQSWREGQEEEVGGGPHLAGSSRQIGAEKEGGGSSPCWVESSDQSRGAEEEEPSAACSRNPNSASSPGWGRRLPGGLCDGACCAIGYGLGQMGKKARPAPIFG
jgi:hypothetical protein